MTLTVSFTALLETVRCWESYMIPWHQQESTLAPLSAPAPLTSLKLNLICNFFSFYCYMGFSWLRVLLGDNSDFSDFCPDLVFASNCIYHLQEPAGMSMAHSQESAGAFLTLCSRACAFWWTHLQEAQHGQRGLGGRVGPPSLEPTHSCAEDLFWPAVLVEGCVDGKLASSSSGISSGFGSPKAEHWLGCFCFSLRYWFWGHDAEWPPLWAGTLPTEVWSGERGAHLLIFQNIMRLRLHDNSNLFLCATWIWRDFHQVMPFSPEGRCEGRARNGRKVWVKG